MEQIERIMKMEQCLDASEKAIRELSEALSAFEVLVWSSPSPPYMVIKSFPEASTDATFLFVYPSSEISLAVRISSRIANSKSRLGEVKCTP